VYQVVSSPSYCTSREPISS